MMTKISDYHSTNSGILLPRGEKPVGFRCGFCTNVIFGHKEADGRLFIKDNKPMCAVCRIKRGRYGKMIRADKKKFLKDEKDREKFVQEKANREMLKVAEESQKKTGTQDLVKK